MQPDEQPNTAATVATTNPVAKVRKSTNITLLEPIERGAQTITQVQVLKPRVGDLRGFQLSDLLGSKTEALVKLLPRITQPTINEAEFWAMDADGLVQFAVEVIGFLSGTDSAAQE
ncbi:phage tail assembly protein [Comamonas sp. J-3]|uniref:phage tail assembly protein n=1 Tax=Comamonas trifloxystrobinivorans TaxID=3350256 RepID=UPI0037289B60